MCVNYLFGAAVMCEFKCSCGELLIQNKTGLTVCWFCRAEYSLNSVEKIVSILYVPQQQLPIIKSLSNPFPLRLMKKNKWINQ